MRQNKAELITDGRFLLSAATAWLLTAIILLLPATAFLLPRNASVQTLAHVSAGVSFLSALSAGAAAVRKRSGAALATALLTALALIICLLTVGFLIRGSALDPAGVLSVASFSLAGCLTGAVLFSKSGKKSKKRSIRA